MTRGGIVTTFAIPTPGSSPYRIAAGPDGAMWFVEGAGNKIGRIAAGPAVVPTLSMKMLAILFAVMGAAGVATLRRIS